MLSAEQKREFDDLGFLKVEGLLDPELRLDPIAAEYDALSGRLAGRLHREGRISSDFAEHEFRARMTSIFEETGQTFVQFFNLSLPMTGVTEETPFWAGPAVFALIRDERMLDALESLIGPEISSNPVQHVRIKPPEKFVPTAMRESGMVGKTPWHQDGAVLPPEAETELVTAWVPISDVPVESGCLVFDPAAHKRGLVRHGFGPVDGLEMPDDASRAESAHPLPAKRGDVIFIHRLCPHGSLPNTSGQVRFSLDLRYHPSHQTSGREMFPSFVARSRSNPSRELRDAEEWTAMWLKARRWLATSPDAPRQSFEWLR